MPLNIKPGRQLYAEFETRKEGAVFENMLGSMTGAG